MIFQDLPESVLKTIPLRLTIFLSVQNIRVLPTPKSYYLQFVVDIKDIDRSILSDFKKEGWTCDLTFEHEYIIRKWVDL
jgi:hypothetical protein